MSEHTNTTMGDTNPPVNTKTITYQEVAEKLLKDRLLLTALELHTELVESGRELKHLKDFFSNPGNFEGLTQADAPLRIISRSESQATLDSLDLTRYSEDGNGTDERVAVLEFELRKAKDTINALRNNLTVATESETSTPVKGSLKNLNSCAIKPHEQRALNFLINEYLLLHGYKLTSITFADENQNQDFDDWDDVGLNIAKPLELLTLYREGLKQSGQNCICAATQTADVEIKSKKYEEIVILMEDEINKLNSRITDLQTDNADLKALNINLNKENELLSSQMPANDDLSIKHTFNSKDSLGSESPSEKFEIIEKNIHFYKNRDSSTLEDNISNNSLNVGDWTNLSINNDNEKTVEKTEPLNKSSGFTLSNLNVCHDDFQKEIFTMCYINIPQKVDNELLDNILNNSITNENLVHILAQALLRIIPNIILNKREEAIPLLISAVLLNTNAKERDKLLQQLFNLKKKPSESERIMILTGIVGIARFSGESLVETEILPQCWEQLTHKHLERRLLVAEACTALVPYVSSQIRNSLLLSMLQQMLDDREEVVRKCAIKALSLVMALCDDSDKYCQCEELVLNILNDPSEEIVSLSSHILFTVLAKWAFNNGRLTTNLMKQLLHRLNDYLKDSEALNKLTDKILNVNTVLENLLPFLLMSTACQPNILCNIEKGIAIEIRPELRKLCSTLTNPATFHQSAATVGPILHEFTNHFARTPSATWPEVDWIMDMMIPDLLNNLNHIEPHQPIILQSFISLFSHFCVVFGTNFTKAKIQPMIKLQINSLEQILTSFNQFDSPSLNLIPVYLVSVLSYCDQEELGILLKKFLCALPLCGNPLDCLEVTVKGLCEVGLHQVVVSALWEGVVHQSPLVRVASANLFSVIVSSCDKSLLNLKVTPALVTLASDSDILVRTAAIPALGALITDCNVKEIHDKVYMQIQSYIGDSSLRENHTILRQLIVTLGNVVNCCSAQFRQEIILPQLANISTYMAQMSNQTRKVDMAQALVESFTNVVYGQFSGQNSNLVILPALRCLEAAVTENQSLISHRDTVRSMIRECDEKTNTSTPPLDRSNNKLSQNVNQGVEEMRQRVSKIFNKPVGSKPNTLPRLQEIFKKK